MRYAEYVIGFCIFLAGYGWWADKLQHPYKPVSVVVKPPRAEYTSVPSRPKSPIADDDQLALSAALDAWAGEIGDSPIGRPALIRGMCPDPDALACAVKDVNAIIVTEDIAGYDEKTIFIHEIGHLLGVPHIEGDPTMAPQYSGIRDYPSKFAVALAKAAQIQP